LTLSNEINREIRVRRILLVPTTPRQSDRPLRESTASRADKALHRRIALQGQDSHGLPRHYEHSLQNKPDEFIVHVPSQLVENIPANLPRALLPEYITDLIQSARPKSGRSGIRHLRIL
jgi:hypothetical protein